MPRIRTPLTVVCVLAVAPVGCTVLFDAEEVQCETTDDCAARGLVGTCQRGLCVAEPEGGGGAGSQGGGGAGPWACIGNVEWPQENMAETANVSLTAIKLIGQTPFEGLAIRSCAPFDLACDPPLSEAISGADGRFTIDVYEGFRGHFYAPPPASWPEMAPIYLQVLPPPTAGEENLAGNLNLASMAELESIVSVLDKERKPGFGAIFFTAFDCDGNRAKDISVTPDTVDPDTFAVYVNDNGFPSATLVGTSARGEGAIANVPPGYITLRGISLEAGLYFEETVLVVADAITGIPIVPSP